MTTPLAPGTRVFPQSQQPASNPILDTGVWFVAGPTQRGPVGSPVAVQSMADYADKLGQRTPSTASLYDALELFFRDGGSQALVSRRVGAASASAALLLRDRASTPATTLQVSAETQGAWGNKVTVAVATSGDKFVLTVVGPEGTETSPPLSSPEDAVNWSSVSRYVTITDQGSASTAPTNNPGALAATPLAGGADDNGNVLDSGLAHDLAVFTSDYGPGQLSVPGATTPAAHQAVLAHAVNTNRIALLDGLDTSDASALAAQAKAAKSGQSNPAAAAHGGVFAPWILIPGVPASGLIPTATRVVAPSALAAAGCARVDRGGNPNVAPAGSEGVSSFAIGVTAAFNDADRALLNQAGVNVSRYASADGSVKLYGFRTMSDDPLHVQMNWARLDMAIFNDAQRIGEQVAEFRQIDARDHVFATFRGALTGMLQQYWASDALYGTTPGDSFVVDVGSDVNTLATRQAGQINAALALKRSAVGEFVNIGVISVSLATPL